MATAKKYQIKPTDNSGDYEIEADRYDFDASSGRHIFYSGTGDKEEVVANLLNVNVRRI